MSYDIGEVKQGGTYRFIPLDRNADGEDDGLGNILRLQGAAWDLSAANTSVKLKLRNPSGTITTADATISSPATSGAVECVVTFATDAEIGPWTLTWWVIQTAYPNPQPMPGGTVKVGPAA